MSTTSHRAFDMTRDIAESVEALVRCGVSRVLTSGQRDTAMEGIVNIRRTVELAGDRLKVMACGFLDLDNIAEVPPRDRRQGDAFRRLEADAERHDLAE